MFSGLFSGVASGAAGIVSSILGNKSQKSANQTNMKIAQMNNEWSERMMDKQNQYDIDMWNRNNEYNSASAQVQRLKDAGLNPALFMGSNSAGSAHGSSSVGLPSPSSTQVQPLQYSGISQAIESSLMLASSLAKNSAEVNYLDTQSDVMRAESKARIAQMEADTRGKDYDTKFRKITESLNVSNLNEEFLGRINSRLIQDQQLVLMKQTEALNRIQILNLPNQMAADISLKIAQSEAVNSTDMAKDLKFFEKKYGIKLSKSELKTIFDAWKFNHNKYQFNGIPDFIGGGISGGIHSIKNALGW